MKASQLPMKRAYAQAWRILIDASHKGKTVKSVDWVHGVCPAIEERKRWLKALHNRINDRVPGFMPTGRRSTNDYYWRLKHDQRKIREIVCKRIIHRQFETAEAKQRFGHLLCTADDF